MATYSSTALRALLLDQFVKAFRYGCIEVYSGAQPANADAAATGTLLARVTLDGTAWTAGSSAGGLVFSRDGIYAGKPSDATWMLTGTAAGTAGWFRLRANSVDAGIDTPALYRADGAIGVDGAIGDYQMWLPDTLAITASTSITVTAFRYALPPLA